MCVSRESVEIESKRGEMKKERERECVCGGWRMEEERGWNGPV